MKEKKYSGKVVAALSVCCVFCVIVSIVSITAKVNETQNERHTVSAQGDAGYDSASDVSETTTTTTTTMATTTQAAPVLPMSEWGFNNSDDWGNKLVKIVGNPDNYMDQSYKNFNDEYVIISEGSAYWDFYPESGQFAQGSFYFDNKQTSMSSSYVVVSNDMISAPSLGGSFEIDERIVIGDIVIFRRDWEYYIPYEMLDIERGPEFYKEDGILDDYKVYLK